MTQPFNPTAAQQLQQQRPPAGGLLRGGFAPQPQRPGGPVNRLPMPGQFRPYDNKNDDGGPQGGGPLSGKERFLAQLKQMQERRAPAAPAMPTGPYPPLFGGGNSPVGGGGIGRIGFPPQTPVGGGEGTIGHFGIDEYGRAFDQGFGGPAPGMGGMPAQYGIGNKFAGMPPGFFDPGKMINPQQYGQPQTQPPGGMSPSGWGTQPLGPNDEPLGSNPYMPQTGNPYSATMPIGSPSSPPTPPPPSPLGQMAAPAPQSYNQQGPAPAPPPPVQGGLASVPPTGTPPAV